MECNTPYGKMTFPNNYPKERRKAILRALSWCEALEHESPYWNRESSEFGVALTRTINGKNLTIHPLAAASLDINVRLHHLHQENHLPVYVDGRLICVVSSTEDGLHYHADLAATFVKLFGLPVPPKKQIPHTLGRQLFPGEFRGSQARQRERREFIDGILEGFRSRVESDAASLSQQLLTVSDEENWTVIRGHFEWQLFPRLTQAVASSIMASNGRRTTDYSWAMESLLTLASGPNREEYLRVWLQHEQLFVRQKAFEFSTFDDEEDAWAALFPLLSDESPGLAWLAHQHLASKTSLIEKLQNFSVELVQNRESVSRMYRLKVLAWLSHLSDMDTILQGELLAMETYEIRTFINSIQTHGPWIGELLHEILKVHPNEGIMESSISVIDSNQSFDPSPILLQIAAQGPGWLMLEVLKRLDRLSEEHAHAVLKLGQTSPWRFVVRATDRALKIRFPSRAKNEAQ